MVKVYIELIRNDIKTSVVTVSLCAGEKEKKVKVGERNTSALSFSSVSQKGVAKKRSKQIKEKNLIVRVGHV